MAFCSGPGLGDELFTDLPEPALAPLVIENGPKEGLAVKIRPEHVGKEEFGIGDLPKEIIADRSEERRVGKECRSRWRADHAKRTEANLHRRTGTSVGVQ